MGLFGGAFDPPHNAHLALARAAIDQLGLDELRVIPTGDAWHKSRSLSPAVHRLKMTELAFAGVAKVRVDDRELRRSGPSYTVDTLQALRAELPSAEFFLLIGGDQWAMFSSWHRWQDILRHVTLVVAERPAIALKNAQSSASTTAPSTALTTASTTANSSDESELQAPAVVQVPASWPTSAKVLRLGVAAMPVSATAIRSKISLQGLRTLATAAHDAAADVDADAELAGMLPESVARYISLHGLYQARPSS